MTEKSQRGIYKLIAAVVLLLLIIIFAIQNSQRTVVTLWFWTMELPLIVIFMMCFLAGLCFSLLAIIPAYREASRKSKHIEALESKLNQLEKNNFKSPDEA